MSRQYQHFTVAVPPAEVDEFERRLQKIKDALGLESTSAVIQKIVSEWAELYWKAQKYDQLRDVILGFEAYYRHRKGELAYEGDEGSF